MAAQRTHPPGGGARDEAAHPATGGGEARDHRAPRAERRRPHGLVWERVHAHHHHAHSHGVTRDADQRRLAIALGLILGFMAVEVIVGLLAGSLALLADAAHMLTDAGALVLSLVAMRLAARPA